MGPQDTLVIQGRDSRPAKRSEETPLNPESLILPLQQIQYPLWLRHLWVHAQCAAIDMLLETKVKDSCV